MTYNLNDTIKLFANFKLNQPFFYNEQLCVITQIYSTLKYVNTEELPICHTEYQYEVVHTYKDNEFIPGLIAQEELIKYNKINKDKVLAEYEKEIKEILLEEQKINQRISQPKEGFINRMKSFHEQSAECGLIFSGKYSPQSLEYEYDKCIEEWNQELTNIQTRYTKLQERKLKTENSKVVFEKIDANHETYYWKALPNFYTEMNALFTNSSEVIKDNINGDGVMETFDTYVLYESNPIKHLPGETIYQDGGKTIKHLTGIIVECKDSIIREINNHSLNYYYKKRYGWPNEYITKEDFEYSNKISELVNKDMAK